MYEKDNLIKVIQTLITHREHIENRSGSGSHTSSINTVKALETTIYALQVQINSLTKIKSSSDKKCTNCKKCDTYCWTTSKRVVASKANTHNCGEKNKRFNYL